MSPPLLKERGHREAKGVSFSPQIRRLETEIEVEGSATRALLESQVELHSRPDQEILAQGIIIAQANANPEASTQIPSNITQTDLPEH